MTGYISIHRKLWDHPYWEDAELLRAWIDILLMAAWKDRRRLVGMHQVDLKRGEFLASERFLADRWGWSRSKVVRFLSCMTEMDEIRTTNRTTIGSTYLVVKYDTYQIPRTTNESSTESATEPAPSQHRAKIEEGNKGKKRKSALSDSWKPNEKHEQLAVGINLQTEASKFRDHAKANGRLQIDWDASFRLWLVRAKEWAPDKAASPQAHITADQTRTRMASNVDEEVRGTQRTSEALKWLRSQPDGLQRDLVGKAEVAARGQKPVGPLGKKMTEGCLVTVIEEARA